MKQYYESEVLFQLMERDGFNIPSSVPPYESEIKAYLINQVKQAYPKLTDYEAEWLLYNYTKHLPAEFPIRSVSDVTEATFENVVPFAYQSAILKGQTLVNIKGQIVNIGVLNTQVEFNIPCVKMNTDYFIKYKTTTTSDVLAIGFLESNLNWSKSLENQPSNGAFILNSGNTPNYFRISGKNSTSTIVDELMIIEYQDGMENWDIPYFEGMKSVKVPVLTTTGKNLATISSVRLEGINYNSGAHYNNIIMKNIPVEEGKTYTISGVGSKSDNMSRILFNRFEHQNPTNSNNHVQLWDEIGRDNTNTTFTIPEGIKYVSFTFGNSIYNNNGEDGWLQWDIIQLEEGSTATSYEPYKSNILSTQEDVVLRKINDVKDELNVITGEYVQRIGEIVLDGSENWSKTANSDGTFRFDTNIINGKFIEQNNGLVSKIICDKYKTIPFNNAYNNTENGICTYSNTSIVINNGISDLETFKTNLQSNPLTVQYQLSTESIKTVDLTTVNENGETTHFMPLEGTMSVQSSGEIIQPTFDMSVPVEATTQNLASFIDLEMEE